MANSAKLIKMEYNSKVKGNNAVVSSARKEASEIGIEILKMGGNAIDAAVAIGFALGVCEPSASGLGGGGFMMLKNKNLSMPIVIDFREIAPKSAHADMWKIDLNGEVVDNEDSIGGKSVCVPGEVAGLIYALENYGTMTLEEVMKPAIKLAESGFVVTEMMYNHFKEKPVRGNAYNNLELGGIYKNPHLADTLRLISKNGKKVFYETEIAEKIIDAINSDNGLITKEDLKNFDVRIKKPVEGEYRGYKIYSCPLPSSGGTHIIQLLNILENFNISSMNVNSAEYIHLFSEIMKSTYSDRAKYMADDTFCNVPVSGLISKDYAVEISQKINLERCGQIYVIDPWNYEHADTTHYSVGDSESVVAVTKTINHFCGSRIMPEKTGFILNDTMADFSPDNLSVNAPGPYKKPLSTMSPTIIMKDDKPFACLGSPGGEKIICIVAQVISKLIDHNMSIDEAIASPRFSDNLENIIMYEERIDENVIKELEKMGHDTKKLSCYDIKMGGVQGIVYLENLEIEGAADPRRDGKAIGY